MHPVLFEVFGFSVGSYGVCIVLGAAAAWFLANALSRRRAALFDDDKIKLIFRENVWMSFLICICGGIVGAFLFRPITRLPEVFIHWESFSSAPIGVVMGYLFGEIVFYGGFIGGLAALVIFCRAYKVSLPPVADIFAPSIALAHAFGRVGCFLGGCCYGVAVNAGHPFAVRYPPETAGGAKAGVPILATQLIEAACLLIIAAVLVVVYLLMVKRMRGDADGMQRSESARTGSEHFSKAATIPEGTVVCLYGLMYSVLRFVLEFYRGDLIRGVYGPFSTSQYVSIALFAVSAVLLYLSAKRKHSMVNLN